MKRIQLRFGKDRENPPCPEQLLKDFDKALKEHGHYVSRAEAIRDLMRQYIYYVEQDKK